MLIPFPTLVVYVYVPLLVHFLPVYLVLIIILHACMHITFKSTNAHFMPTSFHNVWIGDFLFILVTRFGLIIETDLVNPHALRMKQIIIQLLCYV